MGKPQRAFLPNPYPDPNRNCDRCCGCDCASSGVWNMEMNPVEFPDQK
jgi:hypothetical protein